MEDGTHEDLLSKKGYSDLIINNGWIILNKLCSLDVFVFIIHIFGCSFKNYFPSILTSSGPSSIIQSEDFMISILCSITIIVLLF